MINVGEELQEEIQFEIYGIFQFAVLPILINQYYY